MSLYAQLQPCNPLPDTDDVSTYCSKTRYDSEADMPELRAFQKDPRKPDVSGNRLQHYQVPSRELQMDRVRAEVKGYLHVTENGRFIVLNVGGAKAVAQAAGWPIDFKYTPEWPEKPSHVSILGLPDAEQDKQRSVASALQALVIRTKPESVYPGVAA